MFCVFVEFSNSIQTYLDAVNMRLDVAGLV